MKIGFFTNTYYPNTYGSTVSIEYFRNGLERLGHKVFIFTSDFRHYEDRNERIFRYPSVIWKYKIEYPLAFSFYPPIKKIVDDLDLDIVHSHQPFSIGKDGMRQARRKNIPIVFTHHCRYEDYTHYVPLISQAILKWHVKKRATVFANNCDRAIAPTEQIKQTIIKRGVKTPISVLPTGIDWEKFQKGDGLAIRKKFGIKNDETCLLWVGRMQVEKNLDFLFEAIKELIKNNEKIKMIFIGSGPEEKKLKKKAIKEGIENNIFFAGLVNQDRIQEYYRAGDIFAQPSLTETQGMSTIEAMASGLAVVAIKATGAVDLIKDGKTGILVNNSRQKFASALRALAANQAERRRLGENARLEAKKYGYLEKSKQLEGIYLQVIKENHKLV